MNHATPRRFKEVCLRVAIDDEMAEGVFLDLMACYTDESRAYHNLSHIDRMLSWLDDSGGASDSVELAIWFHDAIYEPLGRHNEVKSAQYFAFRIGTFIGGKLAEDVQRLILATDPNRSRSGREDEDLIIDIDLSILGSPPQDYEAYRTAIRREFPSVSDPDFSAGRSLILQSFLSQEIYATEFFSRLEERARLNIKRELEILKAT